MLKNIIRDKNFEQGFLIGSLRDGDKSILGKLKTYGKVEEPVWTIKQWYSRYNILDGTKFIENNEAVFSSEKINDSAAKVIKVNNSGGIYLECNTSLEYDKLRQGREGWPHLLLSQDCEQVKITDCSAINISFDYEITKFKNYIPKQLEDPKLHSSAFIFYFRIKNLACGPDKDDYFWFGIRLYDNRYIGQVTDTYEKKDGCKDCNTGKFIYNPSSEYYFESKVMPDANTRTVINKDFLPLIKKGYGVAKENGYLKDSKIEDMAVSYFNLGWEITGTYDSSIYIKNFSIDCVQNSQ